jgi:hypothetical protein
LSSTEDIYVKDNLKVNFLITSSAPNKATLNPIIPATIQDNPICYLANDKFKNIVLKNLAAIADPSSNSTDTSSCEDSDEGSTVSDTSSNADTDGKANTDSRNTVTGVTQPPTNIEIDLEIQHL